MTVPAAVLGLRTPVFVVDMGALRRNADTLAGVKRRTGCRVLLALKAFSTFAAFPPLRRVLDGVCASSPHEARLGREEFGGEVHAHAPAFSEEDVRDLATTCDHLTFNSFAQWRRFRPLVEAAGRPVACGMRINPEHSESPAALYDPCRPGSRLGVRRVDFEGESLDGLTGLHFHTLCQQNADALQRTLAAVEARFEPLVRRVKWVNFGGGHHITRPDYDLGLLDRLVGGFQDRHGVRVYLEPGEAVALNAGWLVARVLDIVRNDVDIAILDASAACHMPDVLEMPYRPPIVGAGQPGERPHTCRLAGPTCLAGDTIGDYSFDRPLRVGDPVVFSDMAIYTMVKTTTFNGVRLPSIALYDPEEDRATVVREFGYEDFKTRLS
jgi:carboxynorspermidine decarboxylase